MRGPASICAILVLLTGCSTVQPQSGGVATIGKAILGPIKNLGKKTVSAVTPTKKPAPNALETAGDGSLASLRQPDNPGQASSQTFEGVTEEEITFAAPTRITVTEGDKVTVTDIPAGSKKTVRDTRKIGQNVGAAQKDTARADAAWLASFQWIQGVGVLTMLAGAVFFAWPPARALVGKDTAAVIGASGLVLIFGPAILQKYGNYFIVVLPLAGVYWFVSRSKHKEGMLDAIKEKGTP